MTLEDRLRMALREGAGFASPDASDWDVVVTRSIAVRRARRRQQSVTIVVSAAAVAALIVGVFLVGDGPERRDVTTEPGRGDRPAYVVTVEDERVIVRSSDDGRELRVLAEGDDAPGVHRVAVTPDGSTVYFTRAAPACGGARANDFTAEIVRVPITGGPIEHVGWGYSPAVRPDGGAIAYMSDDKHNGCGEEGEIVVHLLGTDEIVPVMRPSEIGYEGLDVLGWSPDIRRLLLAAGPPTDPVKLFVAEVATRGARGVREITMPPNNADPESLGRAAFISNDEIAMWFEDDQRSGVVAVEVAAGRVTRDLFDHQRGAVVTGLRSDVTGGFLLASVEGPAGYSLVRWDAETGVQRLGDYRLRDVAWGRGALDAPDHVVAVTTDRTLEVLRTSDGSRVRTLETDVELEATLTVGPDGRYVYHDGTTTMRCPGSDATHDPVVKRISVADGSADRVTNGWEPQVSPNGRRLAYVASSRECGVRDSLVIVQLNDDGTIDTVDRPGEDEVIHEERWSAPQGWFVSAPRWASDDRMMTLRLSNGVTSTTKLLDTIESSDRLDDADTVVVRPGTHVHGHLTDELLGTAAGQDATDVFTIGPVDGRRMRTLHSIPGIASSVSATPSTDGQHVLIVRSRDGERDAHVYSVGALEWQRLADDVVTTAWLPRLPAAGAS